MADNWARSLFVSNQEQQQELPQNEQQPEEGTGLTTETLNAIQGVGRDVVTSAASSVMDLASGPLTLAEDWYEQEAHIKVMQLYMELGHTDAFLRALYENDEDLSAALDISLDVSVFRFLSDPRLTTSLVDLFPEEAEDKLPRIFNFAPRGAAMTEEMRAMLTRWFPS